MVLNSQNWVYTYKQRFCNLNYNCPLGVIPPLIYPICLFFFKYAEFVFALKKEIQGTSKVMYCLVL